MCMDRGKLHSKATSNTLIGSKQLPQVDYLQQFNVCKEYEIQNKNGNY